MNTHRCECRVVTRPPPGFIDITADVEKTVRDSGMSSGHVTVSAPSGCAIVVNELESGLLTDLERTVRGLQARSNGSTTSIGSASVVLPADDGRLLLGRWQRLLLVELERATQRSVVVLLVGE